MIETAKEEAAYLGLTNKVDLRVVKDESLSMFSDNAFDSVVVVMVLCSCQIL